MPSSSSSLQRVMHRCLCASWVGLFRRGLPAEIATLICRLAFARVPPSVSPEAIEAVRSRTTTREDFLSAFTNALGEFEDNKERVVKAIGVFLAHPHHVTAYAPLQRTVLSKSNDIRRILATRDPADLDALRKIDLLRKSLVPLSHGCHAPYCLNSRARASPNLGLCACHLRQHFSDKEAKMPQKKQPKENPKLTN